MKKFGMMVVSAVVVAGMLAGCGKSGNQGSAVSPGKGEKGKKKFCWVQPLKGHPVHQMTQLGFREGCEKLG